MKCENKARQMSFRLLSAEQKLKFRQIQYFYANIVHFNSYGCWFFSSRQLDFRIKICFTEHTMAMSQMFNTEINVC